MQVVRRLRANVSLESAGTSRKIKNGQRGRPEATMSNFRIAEND